jgi:Family of unknown function (DUF6496)
MATRSTTARRKSTEGKKTATAGKKSATTRKKTASASRKKTVSASRKKTTVARKKSATSRKYSPTAGESVREEMEEFKRGSARSGRKGGKVKSRKQAIAIGLSEARRAGKKVPPNPRRRTRKKSS